MVVVSEAVGVIVVEMIGVTFDHNHRFADYEHEYKVAEKAAMKSLISKCRLTTEKASW